LHKLLQYMCAMLVASYPRRIKVVIAANGATTKDWVKGLNTYGNVIFQFFPFFINLQKCLNCFYFVIVGYCVQIDGEKNISLILEQGCNVTKCGQSRGIWILPNALYIILIAEHCKVLYSSEEYELGCLRWFES
jgi:hypothetical protein